MRRDRWLAPGLGVGFFVLYLLTLCPTVYWFDSAELATAAATLGIPHPPGYPLYTLIGRLFVLLPVEPAYAVNLMSAVFGGVAIGLCYVAARQLGARPVASCVGAASLGGAPLFWAHAVVAEVYTPGLTFLLLTLVLLLHGHRRQRPGYTVAAAGVAGLGLGAHLFLATFGLGFALLVFGNGLTIRRPRELKLLLTGGLWRRRMVVAALCLVATGLGSTIFLYLLFRSRMHPPLNFGTPDTLDQLWTMVTGGHFRAWFKLSGTLGATSIAWVLYNQLFIVGALLAAVGLWRLLRTDALYGIALLLMGAGNIWFFYNYKPPDWEVFFLPTLLVLCLLMAVGAQETFDLVRRLRDSLGRWSRRVTQAGLLLYPAIMITVTYPSVDMSHETKARAYGEALCKQLPRQAILLNFTTVKEWKHHTVFGLYYRKVLGKRQDVAIVNNPKWLHVKAWFSQRPLYFYQPPRRWRGRMTLRREGSVYRVVRLRDAASSLRPSLLRLLNQHRKPR